MECRSVLLSTGSILLTKALGAIWRPCPRGLPLQHGLRTMVPLRCCWSAFACDRCPIGSLPGASGTKDSGPGEVQSGTGGGTKAIRGSKIDCDSTIHAPSIAMGPVAPDCYRQ